MGCEDGFAPQGLQSRSPRVDLAPPGASVKIPDEIAAEAKARGMRVDAYIEENLAQRAGAPPSVGRLRTPAEIRVWLDSLAQFSDKIPPLPEIISREWIYQKRK
jgi:hypothetical protein